RNGGTPQHSPPDDTLQFRRLLAPWGAVRRPSRFEPMTMTTPRLNAARVAPRRRTRFATPANRLRRSPRVQELEHRRLLSTGPVGSASVNLPLASEANRGQTDSQVQFLSRGNGYSLFLTPTESVLRLRNPSASGSDTVLRLQLVGATTSPRAE